MEHFAPRAAWRILFLLEHLSQAYAETRRAGGYCARCHFAVDEEYHDAVDLSHGPHCAVPAAEIELVEKYGLNIAEASSPAALAQLAADAKEDLT